MPSGERGDEHSERQKRTAADLADRAAESVDRRYDATKELHLGESESDDEDQGEGDDEVRS
jgi:hypothetical protein